MRSRNILKMEVFVLKITGYIIFILLNITTMSTTTPLKRQYRTSLAEWTDYNTFQPQGPGTYSFGYDVEDPENDNIQFRDEERFPNGTVRGSYGYLAPNGIVHIVHYTADKNGYRATFENYPRGQLKPLIHPDAEEPVTSSALKAALQSKNVYKKQFVHEQRLRPLDTDSVRKVTELSSSLGSNSNYYHQNGIYSNSQNLNGMGFQNTDPYRLFVQKN